MGIVGGIPEEIEAGAQSLRTVADGLASFPAKHNAAGRAAASACGHDVLALAVDRFSACWSARVDALAIEVGACSMLAANAAADLATAGGPGPR
jgi:hypothetical protein